VDIFFQALALQVDNALVHYRLGLTFRDLALNREATECFRTAIALDDGAVRLLSLSLLVHESRQSCDWSTLEQDTAALLAALDAADDTTGQMLSPFALLAVDATPEQQRRMGAIRARSLSQGVLPLPRPAPPPRPHPRGLPVQRLPPPRHRRADGRAAGAPRQPALRGLPLLPQRGRRHAADAPHPRRLRPPRGCAPPVQRDVARGCAPMASTSRWT
jgi:hypothetical protein